MDTGALHTVFRSSLLSRLVSLHPSVQRNMGFQFTNNEPELSCIGIVATIEFQFQFPSKQVMKSPATWGDFLRDEQ